MYFKDPELVLIRAALRCFGERIGKLEEEIEKLKMPKDSVENPINEPPNDPIGIFQYIKHVLKDLPSGGKEFTSQFNESPKEENYHICPQCKKEVKDGIFILSRGLILNNSVCASCAFLVSEEKPKFKVGQWWETRGGNRRYKITEIDISDNYPIRSGDSNLWLSNGKVNDAISHQTDLVKLIEDVEE